MALHAVCLCAAWCRTCDAYAPLMAALPAPWQARWIDVEDEAELVGDLDIETFPTLLLFDEAALRFAGPVRPDAGTLNGLLEAARRAHEAAAPGLPEEAALSALLARLRDHPAPCSAP